MDQPPPTSDDRYSRINQRPLPHVKLKVQLDVLRKCYDEVHAIQTRIFDASATAKVNQSEWAKLKSEARLATIRTRTIRTQALKTFREVHEYLRRGLYNGTDQKDAAEGLTITASVLFDKLQRENF